MTHEQRKQHFDLFNDFSSSILALAQPLPLFEPPSRIISWDSLRRISSLFVSWLGDTVWVMLKLWKYNSSSTFSLTSPFCCSASHAPVLCLWTSRIFSKISSLSDVSFMMWNSFSSNSICDVSGVGECESTLSGVYGSSSFLTSEGLVEYVLVKYCESILFTTTSLPSIVRFDTNLKRSLGCCLMMFRHILHIFFPSIVSWLSDSSIMLHMQILKLSESTTLMLTKGEIELWWSGGDCCVSGSASADKLSLNFSVMALKCFKHAIHIFGCFKLEFLTTFSLLESSAAPRIWPQLTIPWLDFIRNLRKTGWRRREII